MFEPDDVALIACCCALQARGYLGSSSSSSSSSRGWFYGKHVLPADFFSRSGGLNAYCLLAAAKMADTGPTPVLGSAAAAAAAAGRAAAAAAAAGEGLGGRGEEADPTAKLHYREQQMQQQLRQQLQQQSQMGKGEPEALEIAKEFVAAISCGKYFAPNALSSKGRRLFEFANNILQE
ncbi:hypothetical protein, conserved, partial [Eimeria tenella]